MTQRQHTQSQLSSDVEQQDYRSSQDAVPLTQTLFPGETRIRERLLCITKDNGRRDDGCPQRLRLERRRERDSPAIDDRSKNRRADALFIITKGEGNDERKRQSESNERATSYPGKYHHLPRPSVRSCPFRRRGRDPFWRSIGAEDVNADLQRHPGADGGQIRSCYPVACLLAPTVLID